MVQTRLRISELMDERGMTVADLSEKAGIAYNTALNLRRGQGKRVDLSTLGSVANALGVRVADLFEDGKEPHT